ncbi:MAG: hypothetical protein ACI86X_000858 [Moritella sp.]|jgi:hypothetical protein
MKKLPLALCIAAIVTTTSSYANNGGPKSPHHKSDGDSSVEIDKKIKVNIDANYDISSRVRTSGVGAAVIENDQRVIRNGQRRGPMGPGHRRGPGGHDATSYYHSNTSTISDSSFEGISGNVGVNMADGDHNVQANNVAAAAVAENDATFAFGGDHGGDHGGYAAAGDAEIFSNQVGRGNRVANYASTNRSVIDDSAFDKASGNIGVNMTSGNDNIQSNNLSLSSYNGYVGVANVTNSQKSANNTTSTRGVVVDTYSKGPKISLDLDATGTTSGTSKLAEAYYPEIWIDADGDGAHGDGSATRIGHLDFDENNPSGSEKMTFGEVGDVTLKGSVTGYLPKIVVQVKQKTSNSSHIEDAFRGGVSGNVGVNISAGTGNLQSNSLSLVSLNK